jgi:hypothetical protein
MVITGQQTDLYQIDPTSGNLTNLGLSGVAGMNGIAAPSPLPAVSIVIEGGSPQECSEINASSVNFTADVRTLPDDPAASVEWFLDGSSVGLGENITTKVQLGAHSIDVVVTTANGVTFGASEAIDVVDTIAPSISISFSDSKGDAVTTVTRSGLNFINVNYPVTDICDPMPSAWGVGGVDIANGQLVLIQATTEEIRLEGQQIKLSVTAEDASGNINEAEAALYITD